IGVTGHGDVTPRTFLIEGCAQFTAVQKPLFKILDRLGSGQPLLKLIVQGGNLCPLPKVNRLRHKPAWLIGRQITERQQIHPPEHGRSDSEAEVKSVSMQYSARPRKEYVFSNPTAGAHAEGVDTLTCSAPGTETGHMS